MFFYFFGIKFFKSKNILKVIYVKPYLRRYAKKDNPLFLRIFLYKSLLRSFLASYSPFILATPSYNKFGNNGLVLIKAAFFEDFFSSFLLFLNN